MGILFLAIHANLTMNLCNIYARRSTIIKNAIFDDDDDDGFTEVVIKHRLSVEGRSDSVDKECEDVDQVAADVEDQKDSLCIDERSNGRNMPSDRERVRCFHLSFPCH